MRLRMGSISMRNFEPVVLVGTGMANLVAAALLVNRGHRVVMLEQCETPGGYFSSFTNEMGDRFELAVSSLLGGTCHGSLVTLLRELGLEEQIALTPADIIDVMHIHGRRIVMPRGLDNLELNLVSEFPRCANELRQFISFMKEFMGEGEEQTDPRKRGRFMMRNYQRGFEEFCRETISNDLLRSILAMRIQCDESALMVMAGFFTECYGKGQVSVSGGVDHLVTVLNDFIRTHGGDIIFGARMADLSVCDDMTTDGDILENGDRINAKIVLYGGDIHSLEMLLTSHDLGCPSNSNRRRGHSSLSMFYTLENVNLNRLKGTVRHYVTETPDVFETYRILESGRRPEYPVIKVHVCSDNKTADERELLRVEVDTFHVPEMHDRAFYVNYARDIENMIVDKLIPELKYSTVYRRVIDPIDYQSWFGHSGGSATGWAHDVHNYMTNRLSQHTVLANVFITGQWGEFGSGLPQLIESARKSVNLTEQFERTRANR